MAKKEKNQTFEDALSRLETLVEKMESGEGTLEQSLDWFEEGMSLIKSCRQELESAEQKVKELIKNTEGGYTLKDQQ
ncbi:MAG: exodeoxyribonuclease VII small subunit [Candidatus Neomarinimicrobiota bacterium]|jgi:exodeoxyribonuclease VII small subunit|nr:exodeoxyribonuclease VII small subunit [Candidatus Neomarinimicrobiota bacterium]MEC7745494.1 exodeoxyribonuclease VII small subunit [Candidatus Neomarinimicrobiota bacterium]|tara:strand:+ start:5624 stop:5854 length:231 start_codon:yes stop_codon:yes gene_type:complete